MQITTSPKITPATPTPMFSANARQIVANPEQYADRPTLRALAWSVLLSERGGRIDAQRLASLPAVTS